MNKKCKLSVFVLVTVVVLLIAIAGNDLWVSFVKQSKVEETFAITSVGASKKELVRELGAPDEIEFCGKPDAVDAINSECEEKYWYKVFISRWGFSFDKNGTVIHKTHNVSY